MTTKICREFKDIMKVSINDTCIRNTKVGNLINAKYDQGAWTPHQKERAWKIVAAVASALAFIAACALSIAFPAVSLAVIPLCILSVVLVNRSIVETEIDFDDPRVRRKVQDDLVHAKLNGFMMASPTKTIGYDLLKAKMKAVKAEDKAKVYAYVERLTDAFNKLTFEHMLAELECTKNEIATKDALRKTVIAGRRSTLQKSLAKCQEILRKRYENAFVHPNQIPVR